MVSRPQVALWQTQPAGASDRWLQVLGEVVPLAGVGPLPPDRQLEVELILSEGSCRVSRADVAGLVEALAGWLDRTRPTAELPRRGAYGRLIPAGQCGAYGADQAGEHMCTRPLGHDGPHQSGAWQFVEGDAALRREDEQ